MKFGQKKRQNGESEDTDNDSDDSVCFPAHGKQRTNLRCVPFGDGLVHLEDNRVGKPQFSKVQHGKNGNKKTAQAGVGRAKNMDQQRSYKKGQRKADHALQQAPAGIPQCVFDSSAAHSTKRFLLRIFI